MTADGKKAFLAQYLSPFKLHYLKINGDLITQQTFITNLNIIDTVFVYNESTVLLGGFDTVGIIRYDFDDTSIWKHSQVHTLPGDKIFGIAFHPLKKTEGFICQY